MRKLFVGRFGRIPMAVLSAVLLSVLIVGAVVAATSGYVLWEGSSEITVTEPIHIYYGSTDTTCDTELLLDDPLGASAGLWPGVCLETWFELTSLSPDDLLIRATLTSSNSTMVTVDFSIPGITTTGLTVNSSGPVFVKRTVCVNGTAAPGLYTVSTGFTRESP